MRVIDYKLVMEPDGSDLEKRVVRHLGRGWQPLGGIVVNYHHDRDMMPSPICFAQAMVKYAEEEQDEDD